MFDKIGNLFEEFKDLLKPLVRALENLGEMGTVTVCFGLIALIGLLAFLESSTGDIWGLAFFDTTLIMIYDTFLGIMNQ